MEKHPNRVLNNYFTEIGKYKSLEIEEEVVLIQRIKQGDTHAKDELINANLGFVVYIAKKYQGLGSQLEDLINDGNLGMIRAVEKFDETRGFKFISFAVWDIRQSILESLSKHSRMVRVPSNVQETITKVRKAVAKLGGQLERQPSIDEIAKYMNMEPRNVTQILNSGRWYESLDTPPSGKDTKSHLDTLPDEQLPEPDSELFDESLKQDLRQVLDTLTDREQAVVKYYFGIDQEYSLTLMEIGKIYGLSRERVRQIKAIAIRRLQHKSRNDRLRPYQ